MTCGSNKFSQHVCWQLSQEVSLSSSYIYSNSRRHVPSCSFVLFTLMIKMMWNVRRCQVRVLSWNITTSQSQDNNTIESRRSNILRTVTTKPRDGSVVLKTPTRKAQKQESTDRLERLREDFERRWANTTDASIIDGEDFLELLQHFKRPHREPVFSSFPIPLHRNFLGQT